MSDISFLKRAFFIDALRLTEDEALDMTISDLEYAFYSNPPVVSAPSIASSPLATLATVSATVWPTANLAVFQRFSLPKGNTYRYINVRLDVSAGNWQLAVVRLSGAGFTAYDRVMNTGVVAAPVAGDKQVDLGATYLEAGDYAIAMWASDITLQTRYATNSGVSSTKLSAETSGLVAGIPTSGTVAWNSARFIGGLTLER